MTILRDQRHLSSPSETYETDEEVEASWHAWQLRPGFLGWPYRGFEWGIVEDFEIEIRAFVDGGRWVAECPNCGTGMAARPGAEIGVCCLGCGTVYRSVVYPHANTIRAAERALAARPPERRAWNPDEEDAADLRAENVAHGLPEAGDPYVVAAEEIRARERRDEALEEAHRRLLDLEARKRERRQNL